MELNWKNLKENKCPQCDRDFTVGMSMEFRQDFLSEKPAEKFITHKCGFAVSERQYSQVVNSQITAELEEKWNNELEGGEY